MSVSVCQSGGVQSSAVAAVECQLSWLESHLLPCLTDASGAAGARGVARLPQRRHLVSSNCTLLMMDSSDHGGSDADTTAATPGLSQSVFATSDSSVVSQSTHVSADTRRFVTAIIKVHDALSHCSLSAYCNPSCECGQRQTINHIVDACPLTEVEGGLNLLHEADNNAFVWLESTANAALAK